MTRFNRILNHVGADSPLVTLITQLTFVTACNEEAIRIREYAAGIRARFKLVDQLRFPKIADVQYPDFSSGPMGNVELVAVNRGFPNHPNFG